MNYKTLRFLIPALGAAMLLSCEVEELVPAGPVQSDEIKPVTVSLQLSLAGEMNGTPQTRAIDDPADEHDTQIHNLCILQYDGTGNDARLVGDVHYLRSDVDPEDENFLNLSAVKLADSWGATHTLVILTNTFTQIGGDAIRTLGGMLSLWRTVGGEPDVFGHTGQGESFPNDTDYYQRMNALVVSVISNEATIKGTLRRSMARINVEIDNDGTDGLQIRQVQLRNVSMKDYYVTDYSYIDANDAVQQLRDTPFQDEYNPSVPMRSDYAAMTWADGGGTDTGGFAGTGTATYRWYVASNMRGTSDNLLPSQKNLGENAAAATYLYVLGAYGPNHDELIVYKFYLGENLVNDFNLKPNHSYTYRLTFRGKGDTVTDQRVDDYGSVNFKVDANCYIVNPPVEGSRKYTFNVVHRPNTFWGGPNSGDRYGFYNNSNGQYPSNFIGTEEAWTAWILWSDAAYTMNDVLTRRTGNGGGSYDDACQRVELTIPSDITEGNMIIGVSSNDAPDIILWSWHIWITKYQPDDIVGHAPDAGVYVYNVDGGEVHRYKGTRWDGASATYRNGYIMDRSLGALDQQRRMNQKGGGLFYQFGRKDPFPGYCTVYSYNSSGTRKNYGNNSTDPLNQNPFTGTSLKISFFETGQGGRHVPWSVNNPRYFIHSSGYWTYNDIFNPSAYNSGIIWQDPYYNQHGDNEETGATASKSIFDPCPPGWRVPLYDTWSDFKGDNAGSSTTDPTVNFQNGNNKGLGTGRTYYPNTFLTDHSSGAPSAFYPIIGVRYTVTYGGSIVSQDLVGETWSCSPLTTEYASALLYQTNYVGLNTRVYRAMGSYVRCVRQSAL